MHSPIHNWKEVWRECLRRDCRSWVWFFCGQNLWQGLQTSNLGHSWYRVLLIHNSNLLSQSSNRIRSVRRNESEKFWERVRVGQWSQRKLWWLNHPVPRRKRHWQGGWEASHTEGSTETGWGARVLPLSRNFSKNRSWDQGDVFPCSPSHLQPVQRHTR